MSPKTYRKTALITAVQFTGMNFEEIEEFVGGDAEFRAGKLVVATLEGPLHAAPMDYIAKGSVEGEFWPIRQDIFADTYEEVV